MGILSFVTDLPGQVGVTPRRPKIITTDSLVTVTTAGYLNNSILTVNNILSTDVIDMVYSYNTTTNTGTYIELLVSIGQTGVITLINQNAVQVGPITIASSVSSTTPGTVRSVIGSMTETATVMTSGNLVGVRGSVTFVGASGGFLYGTQGKVTATGTLSGSSWTTGIFGQLDISSTTINAGQTAAIWGDYGTSSGTISDATGMRGVSMTNTTAAVLNAQDYRYGNATYLQELTGAGGTLNYYLAAGTASGSAGNSTHCAAQQVIRVQINGVAAYIPIFTQNT